MANKKSIPRREKKNIVPKRATIYGVSGYNTIPLTEAILYGYTVNALSPADLAAKPKMTLADFTSYFQYQIPWCIGIINLGRDDSPIYEERYELKTITVTPDNLIQGLVEFMGYVGIGSAFKTDTVPVVASSPTSRPIPGYPVGVMDVNNNVSGIAYSQVQFAEIYNADPANGGVEIFPGATPFEFLTPAGSGVVAIRGMRFWQIDATENIAIVGTITTKAKVAGDPKTYNFSVDGVTGYPSGNGGCYIGHPSLYGRGIAFAYPEVSSLNYRVLSLPIGKTTKTVTVFHNEDDACAGFIIAGAANWGLPFPSYGQNLRGTFPPSVKYITVDGPCRASTGDAAEEDRLGMRFLSNIASISAVEFIHCWVLATKMDLAKFFSGWSQMYRRLKAMDIYCTGSPQYADPLQLNNTVANRLKYMRFLGMDEGQDAGFFANPPIFDHGFDPHYSAFSSAYTDQIYNMLAAKVTAPPVIPGTWFRVAEGNGAATAASQTARDALTALGYSCF